MATEEHRLPMRSSSNSTQAYQKVKVRAKARSAAITLAGQDITPLPKIADSVRRTRADRDFKFFCEAYFPHFFPLTWSQDGRYQSIDGRQRGGRKWRIRYRGRGHEVNAVCHCQRAGARKVMRL